MSSNLSDSILVWHTPRHKFSDWEVMSTEHAKMPHLCREILSLFASRKHTTPLPPLPKIANPAQLGFSQVSYYLQRPSFRADHPRTSHAAAPSDGHYSCYAQRWSPIHRPHSAEGPVESPSLTAAERITTTTNQVAISLMIHRDGPGPGGHAGTATEQPP